MRLGTRRSEAQYCSISARLSGRFSSREIVDCEHNSSSEGKSVQRQLEHRIVAQRGRVIAVLVPGGENLRQPVHNLFRCPRVIETDGRRSGNPSRRPTSRNTSNPPPRTAGHRQRGNQGLALNR
jgi:hypothetical protein